MRECPYCLVATKVVSEKPFAGYGLEREHECRVCKRVYGSLEIPRTVVHSIGTARIRDILGQFSRGIRRSVEAAKLAAEVTKMTAEGFGTHLVAHALGRTPARVRQIKAAQRAEGQCPTS